MRRVVRSLAAASLLSLVVAGTAFAAHCQNDSKQADAGQHLDVIVNVITGAVTFVGKNGGFADVWLDVDGNGTPDVLACDDVFIVSNHSPHGVAPGQAEGGGPGALPPIIRGADPGGDGVGLGSC
jgi:hypothetical protein